METAAQTDQLDNLEFVQEIRTRNAMTYKELSKLAEYSEEYVRAWFASEGSSKHRPVPDRAVTIIKLKLTSKGVTT